MNIRVFIVAIVALAVLAVATVYCIYKEDLIVAFGFGLLTFGIVEYFVNNEEEEN